MDCFLRPHMASCTTNDCWVFPFWFQALDKLNCCRQSQIMSQINFTRRCVPLEVHGCISRKPFLTLFTYISFQRYLSKVDRWPENLNRQKLKPDDQIKGHVWSVCRNTDNNEHGFVRFSSMTSNFLDNTCTKIQNMAFKTSQMDQIALEYWYYGFLGRLRVDGRGFLHHTPILKYCSPEQKSSCRTCTEACHSPLTFEKFT